jgi:hypothetical protein
MTDEVSMTIWGRNTDMGLVFTGLPWVFDYITAQRPRQTEESFDEEVIFAFFRGVGEGAGSGLAQNMETLIQTYKRHALFLPILQFKLWQGALDGIAEEAANTLFFITQFASDPMRQSTEITKAIRHTLTALYEQPQSTFFDFGKALGKDFSKKVEGLITPENQESPGHFLYDLGKLVGPVLLNILLSIIQPEFVLRFGLTVGENLLRFVKGFVDLKAIASASAWKALALDAVDLGFLSKTKSIGILTDPGDIKREMGIVFKVAPREVTEGLKSRFDFEISLGEGHHTWRGTKDGTWCRFTDEKCYLIRPGQYGRGEPDLMETDPRLTKDRPMPDVATQRRLEAGVSEYERTLRKRVSRVVAAPEGQKTIFRRSGHAALDMELIRRGYTLDLDGWQLTMEARFPSQSIDLDMRIGASPEYPTNRQRMRNGLPAYLDPEHMIEIHHVEQDFFRTQEISSSYHYLSHEELHPYFGDLSYVSWRREMAWFEGSVRTLEDIYSILSRRYWRARLAELEP